MRSGTVNGSTLRGSSSTALTVAGTDSTFAAGSGAAAMDMVATTSATTVCTRLLNLGSSSMACSSPPGAETFAARASGPRWDANLSSTCMSG